MSDDVLQERAAATKRAEADLIAARLPDPGSVMSGDFGEILVFLYQAAKEHPATLLGPKKWRLKQDRTKPAPRSDVVHFMVPQWPQASEDDAILCAEVKTKATNGSSTPIRSAIRDCAKDRTSRLAATLLWMRERALFESLGVPLDVLDRFIRATEHPPATKRFRAVAVICSSLVQTELGDAPSEEPEDYSVVVIAVPQLRDTYTKVFDSARGALSTSVLRRDPATEEPSP